MVAFAILVPSGQCLAIPVPPEGGGGMVEVIHWLMQWQRICLWVLSWGRGHGALPSTEFHCDGLILDFKWKA